MSDNNLSNSQMAKTKPKLSRGLGQKNLFTRKNFNPINKKNFNVFKKFRFTQNNRPFTSNNAPAPQRANNWATHNKFLRHSRKSIRVNNFNRTDVRGMNANLSRIFANIESKSNSFNEMAQKINSLNIPYNKKNTLLGHANFLYRNFTN